MTASDTDQPGWDTSPRAALPGVAGAGQLASRVQVAVRAATARPAIQGLLALVVYVAVFIVWYAFPLLHHVDLAQTNQTSPDPNFYIWSWRWWPYAIAHGLNPLFSGQVGAPGGSDLSWTTTTPALAVPLAPVTLAFGPIVSFNLTLAFCAPVSAWAAFIAARRLTGRFWAALLAGTVYGFSWYEVAETGVGHVNLCAIMLLPLTLYLTLLWRDGKLGRGWFVGLMAATMVGEFYIFNETFVDMTVLWAAGLLIGFAVARPAERQFVARLARLVALAWVAAMVLAAPYLVYALRHYPAGGFTKVQPAFSLNLDELVHPRSGILLLVLVLALAVFTWSSRLTRFLVIGFVLTVVLAVGPVVVLGNTQLVSVPWARVWYLPVARNTQPLRMMIFGYLVLAIILAVWLAMPARHQLLAAARWILGLATVAAIVVNMHTLSGGNVLPSGVPSAVSGGARPTWALPAFINSGLYRRYLRPGEIVVVVSNRGNAGMLYQADMNFYVRVAGGFINRSFSTTTSLPVPVENLMKPSPEREREFRAYVRQAGVGAIIVDRAWALPWMSIFSQMGLHGTAVGGVIVYRTG